MTSEYEMQNFWKVKVELKVEIKEEVKEENYCYYSDLPSPMAYMDLEEEEEDIKD